MKKLNLLFIAFALFSFIAFYNCQGTSKPAASEEPVEEVVEEASEEADSVAVEADSAAVEEEAVEEVAE